MNRHIGFLLICVTLSGCTHLRPETCYRLNNNAGELFILKPNAKALDWFDLYYASNQLSEEGRESLLTSLDQRLNVSKKPDTNTKSITNAEHETNTNANTCYQSLHLHKATYLASTHADRENWLQSITLLTNLDNRLPFGMRKYALWLQSELSTRLKLVETAERLEKENAILVIRAKRLQKKIEALTNIEQSLTERKEAQGLY